MKKDVEDVIMEKMDSKARPKLVFSSRISLSRYTSLLRCRSNDMAVFVDKRTDIYPENQTDQTHALSLAQQIRRGQIDGSMLNDTESSDQVAESTLPFYNREEFSMQEHDFKERIKSNYDSALAKRREEAVLKQAEAQKTDADNFKEGTSATVDEE